MRGQLYPHMIWIITFWNFAILMRTKTKGYCNTVKQITVLFDPEHMKYSYPNQNSSVSLIKLQDVSVLSAHNILIKTTFQAWTGSRPQISWFPRTAFQVKVGRTTAFHEHVTLWCLASVLWPAARQLKQFIKGVLTSAGQQSFKGLGPAFHFFPAESTSAVTNLTPLPEERHSRTLLFRAERNKRVRGYSTWQRCSLKNVWNQ